MAKVCPDLQVCFVRSARGGKSGAPLDVGLTANHTESKPDRQAQMTASTGVQLLWGTSVRGIMTAVGHISMSLSLFLRIMMPIRPVATKVLLISTSNSPVPMHKYVGK